MSSRRVEVGENVTTAVYAGVTGTFIPLFFVFKGKRFYNEFSEGFPIGIKISGLNLDV